MIKKEIQAHYESGIELQRLSRELYLTERIRTQELLLRYIHKKPSKILDVGGGTGFYSFYLSDLGHEVHLLDPVPMHIEEAILYSRKSEKHLASISVGEARRLKFDENYFDLVLLFGPLYHLTERSQRIKALVEAKRVLAEGGICLGVGVSRYASMLDGYFRHLVRDPHFVEIMNRDLRNGHHRNPTDNLDYWTTAYLHKPEELKEETLEAGFRFEKLLAVDSFGWLIPDISKKLEDTKYREQLLQSIKTIEEEPWLLGISAHIMVVARK